VIHLKTAPALGLPLPPTVLFQADAVLKEESVGARLVVGVGEHPVRKPGIIRASRKQHGHGNPSQE
jgi:hypothetical protein